MQRYDIAIIGAGPAGLSAGLYAARDLMNTVIFEKNTAGGLIIQTDVIENYPGAPEDSSGFSLADRMRQQAVDAGCTLLYEDITSVEKAEGGFILRSSKEEYLAAAVIIAGGSVPRKLGVSGEAEFTGRGVSYCATCDAMFFRGKVVGVSGGGDSAVKEANFLTRFASKVYLFHRRDELRARGEVKERILNNPKCEILYNRTVEKINGDMKVTSVELKDTVSGEVTELPLDGVFVFNGFVPDTGIFKELVETDGDGWIITDERMRTSVPGIFAAGDVRNTVLRQVVTAAADGAIAATQAGLWVDENGGKM
ncbi:MAG: thioredoxin-disulfide reductase [Oscillospiraceae bacterium]|nr:thioredoxin-disulfide reductase [Oscillospiraceae bacterium]